MGTPAENKALVQRAVDEFFNGGDLESSARLFADDYVWHPGDGISPSTNLEGHRRDYTRLRTAMPDLELTVDDMVADGDKVVTRFTITGTQSGNFKLADQQVVKPTNKRVTWTGVTIHRVDGDKIAEAYIHYDKVRMDKQLGLETTVPAGIRG